MAAGEIFGEISVSWRYLTKDGARNVEFCMYIDHLDILLRVMGSDFRRGLDW
jgi:hypothetical protein